MNPFAGLNGGGFLAQLLQRQQGMNIPNVSANTPIPNSSLMSAFPQVSPPPVTAQAGGGPPGGFQALFSNPEFLSMLQGSLGSPQDQQAPPPSNLSVLPAPINASPGFQQAPVGNPFGGGLFGGGSLA